MSKGLAWLCGAGSFVLWGVFPLYFKAVNRVPVFELLAHRVFWAFVMLLCLSAVMGRRRMVSMLSQLKRRWWALFVSACLIGINWLVFIWAVINERTLEASFGYFLNPLLIVMTGVLFFKEKLNVLQLVSLVLAVVAIVYQLIQLGSIPWVSLVLATSFACYGAVRKVVAVDSLTGLLAETALLSPLALVYLIVLAFKGELFFTQHSLVYDFALISAGLVTSVPLLLFAIGVRYLDYSSVGFLQYIAPSLQFLMAIFVFKEPINSELLVSFALVWLGLILLSFSPILLRARPNQASLGRVSN